jgi:hypothetical protein
MSDPEYVVDVGYDDRSGSLPGVGVAAVQLAELVLELGEGAAHLDARSDLLDSQRKYR